MPWKQNLASKHFVAVETAHWSRSHPSVKNCHSRFACQYAAAEKCLECGGHLYLIRGFVS